MLKIEICCLRPYHVENTGPRPITEIKQRRAPLVVVVVALLFYVHGKHLWSCRDGQLTLPHFSWAGLDLLSG